MNGRLSHAKRSGIAWTLLVLAVVASAVQIVQLNRRMPGPHFWPLVADVAIGLYATASLARSRARSE